jgi:protein-S-isoprenylcysteine O-methyltransferase Ste14
MSGVLQLVGAATVLLAFIATQLDLAQPSSRVTLTMNLLGSAVLAVLALAGRQWGFLLLEGAWAIVSAAGLGRRLARAGP